MAKPNPFNYFSLSPEIIHRTVIAHYFWKAVHHDFEQQHHLTRRTNFKLNRDAASGELLQTAGLQHRAKSILS